MRWSSGFFVIHAWMGGVSVFHLFKADLNTICEYIHIHSSQQTRGDGRCKKACHTRRSCLLTTTGRSPRHPVRAFTIIMASIAASIDRCCSHQPKGGGLGGRSRSTFFCAQLFEEQLFWSKTRNTRLPDNNQERRLITIEPNLNAVTLCDRESLPVSP